jgi:hypothetical protein
VSQWILVLNMRRGEIGKIGEARERGEETQMF